METLVTFTFKNGTIKPNDMERYFEVTGFYGSGNTPCTILCYADSYSTMYVVDGGTIVNNTYDTLEDGVNVEELSDFDCFTVSSPIETLKQLETAINA